MKKILRVILPAVMLAGMLVSPAMAQTSRIATIDLRKVFDNYWKKTEAEAVIKKNFADLDKEFKGMQDDHKKLVEDYNKLLETANDQSVTQQERDKRKAAAEAKIPEIKTSENSLRIFEENAREQMESQKKRMKDNILADILTAVKAKAKSSGFILVLDTATDNAGQTPVVLYSNGDNDLTDAILTQLNLSAPPPSSEPGPATTTNTTDKGTGK